MKVFISWSGDLSHKLAIILRDWLPSVIQSLEPYVSSEDIDKGARWSTDLSKELEASSYGILCVTRDNVDAPWLNFEAGALSRLVDQSRVSPFLFSLKRSEVKGPLLQFQSTISDKEDVRKLVHSLNKAEETGLIDEGRLDGIFDVWWPRLAEQLDELKRQTPASPDADRSGEDLGPLGAEVLEELLELVRQQHRLLNSPEALLPPGYIAHALRQADREFMRHPVFRDLYERWRELAAIVDSLSEDEPVPASLVRELVARLADPIEFITRRAGMRIPSVRFRGRRSPEGSE